jgi:hypothetical protein
LEEPGVWQTHFRGKKKRGGGTGVWQTLGKKKERKKKKRGKKKEYIHTHSYTQVVVHVSMYDGEEA